MKTIHQYKVADRCFRICEEALVQAVQEMPGFEPFQVSDEEIPGFEIHYQTVEAQHTNIEVQYRFSADGVNSVFSSIDGGHLLEMQHENGTHLNLWSVASTRSIYLEGCLAPQMLRFALWIAYGLMNVNAGRIPIHGSCIVNHERAYLFLGESGTGKSTHTRLWRTYIEGSTLLNDDSPIIAAEKDGVWIYGSPWSGKTPCYKQERYPLGGCVRLSQAPYNQMNKLNIFKAYAALHPSCPPEFAYDEGLYEGISQSLDIILSHIPVFHLACLPDEDAAELSHRVLALTQ